MIKVTVSSDPAATVSAGTIVRSESGGGAGGFYIPNVSQPDDNTMLVEYTPSDTSMPTIDAKNITLPTGAPGKDGITPTIGDNGNWYLGSTDTGKTSHGKSAYTYAVEAGYTGTEAAFAERMAAEIPTSLSELSEDATHRVVTDAEKAEWNAKSNFSGSYNDLTDKPTIPDVPVQSVNGKTGAVVLSADDVGALPDSTVIPEALPNPNALTFTGAVTGSYDGSAPVSLEIPSAVTDSHINSLIDAKLGVIENGSY